MSNTASITVEYTSDEIDVEAHRGYLDNLSRYLRDDAATDRIIDDANALKTWTFVIDVDESLQAALLKVWTYVVHIDARTEADAIGIVNSRFGQPLVRAMFEGRHEPLRGTLWVGAAQRADVSCTK